MTGVVVLRTVWRLQETRRIVLWDLVSNAGEDLGIPSPERLLSAIRIGAFSTSQALRGDILKPHCSGW